MIGNMKCGGMPLTVRKKMMMIGRAAALSIFLEYIKRVEATKIFSYVYRPKKTEFFIAKFLYSSIIKLSKERKEIPK